MKPVLQTHLSTFQYSFGEQHLPVAGSLMVPIAHVQTPFTITSLKGHIQDFVKVSLMKPGLQTHLSMFQNSFGGQHFPVRGSLTVPVTHWQVPFTKISLNGHKQVLLYVS
jgi:hypothetical protein